LLYQEQHALSTIPHNNLVQVSSSIVSGALLPSPQPGQQGHLAGRQITEIQHQSMMPSRHLKQISVVTPTTRNERQTEA